MRPGWVAGTTRARLLLSRAIGAESARAIAGERSLAAGLAALAGSAYGERVHPGADLASAERGVAETLLWHLRILAGWLPAAGAGLVRALAGRLELQNVDARLAALATGAREAPPLNLGGLATAWPAVARAHSTEQAALALSASAWGTVPGRSTSELAIGLRVAWARRVLDAAPAASAWVAGACALLLARELFVAGTREHVEQLRRLPAVDERALHAGSLSELRLSLPERAGWALAGVEAPEDLWRAELGWWERVERDARALLETAEDEGVVLAAVALLATDAERTREALALAARGGMHELAGALDGAGWGAAAGALAGVGETGGGVREGSSGAG